MGVISIKKKVISVILSICAIFSVMNTINISAVEKTSTSDDFQVIDILNLKKYLLNISDKNQVKYDLDQNNSINIIDFIILKQMIFKNNLPSEENDILVVYFSGTGNTRVIAEYSAEIMNADLYEIVPKIPYTTQDLDYNNNNCRANVEMNDPSARPEIDGTIENIEDYETIFLGYPIWWGTAPRIVDNFIESYDFSNKTIVPFCTSGSSGINTSIQNLKLLCNGNPTWVDGTRLNADSSKDEISNWIDSLGLNISIE